MLYDPTLKNRLCLCCSGMGGTWIRGKDVLIRNRCRVCSGTGYTDNPCGEVVEKMTFIEWIRHYEKKRAAEAEYRYFERSPYIENPHHVDI